MKTIDIPSENGKLTYFWEEGAGSGKKPLIVCLASGEGEARESLALVFSQANGASAAALVVNPQTQGIGSTPCGKEKMWTKIGSL